MFSKSEAKRYADIAKRIKAGELVKLPNVADMDRLAAYMESQRFKGFYATDPYRSNDPVWVGDRERTEVAPVDGWVWVHLDGWIDLMRRKATGRYGRVHIDLGIARELMPTSVDA